MPLFAQVMDADTVTPRKIRWGWWHMLVLTDVARREGGWPEDMPMLEVWSLNGGHHEVEGSVGYKDPDDGEVFILNRGDMIEVWRE